MDTPERRDKAPMTRRHALGGVAAAAAAFPLLAACGGDTSGTGGGDSAGGNSDDKAPDTAKKTPKGDDTRTPADDDAAKGGGGGDSLASTSQIPVKGGKIFAAQKVVVTQPQQGTFKAFSATCTHRGCTVGDVTGDTIRCRCHGSAFSALDGSVKQGPATRPLPPVKIEVEGSSIKLG
ncbi:Rieske (2Fe-2S) protein [Actinopolymorpha singaporensis]|uniref:Cytochrome bc1 complex Rieske iron-sulfur subunit n=1 Tax=Actinopolymorpha singaporensis TaxID=117157 RepID=A0A1H1WGV1_9ACTN|nr:Rieske (2Fe-2S) protein [Actinopolymorpha singaporensis]SDS96314.1 Rieske [2Fe-2S] domain-containing protein [Actinopolymorpha singaporensis]